MRLVHCADLHLDSPLGFLGDEKKAEKRRAELLLAFAKMADFAIINRAEAVLIAGDLFDSRIVSAGAKQTVLGILRSHPQIGFYYLRGNHDRNDLLLGEKNIPENLHLFENGWTRYDLGENIVLTGAELCGEEQNAEAELRTDPSAFNIVMLHGMLSEDGSGKDGLSARQLRGKNIDYLALGHLHSYSFGRLDARGYYCYPGCLEARGYDEGGVHGCVLLEIDPKERAFRYGLRQQPLRRVQCLQLDITDLEAADIPQHMRELLVDREVDRKDMVQVELTGSRSADEELSESYLQSLFADHYFDFRLKNSSRVRIPYESYRRDETLKGEFVRLVEGREDLSREQKAEIIRMGIKALRGEDVL